MALFVGSGREDGDNDDRVYVVDAKNREAACNIIVNLIAQDLSVPISSRDLEYSAVYLLTCRELSEMPIVTDGDDSTPTIPFEDCTKLSDNE